MSVKIPAQPVVVSQLIELSASQDVAVSDLAALVKKDASLSAQLLKVTNSPIFGLRHKVESVPQALSLLGIKGFKRTILTSALKEIYGREAAAPWFEAFWRHTECVAACCNLIAKRVCPELAEEAYLAGLFHDCGIPLMIKRFPEYEALALEAMGADAAIAGREDECFGANHAVVGYLLARSWKLSESICLAIMKHHDQQDCLSVDNISQQILAVLMISEYVVQNYDGTGNLKIQNPDEWHETHADVVGVFGLCADDINDINYQFADVLLAS